MTDVSQCYDGGGHGSRGDHRQVSSGGSSLVTICHRVTGQNNCTTLLVTAQTVFLFPKIIQGCKILMEDFYTEWEKVQIRLYLPRIY